MKTELIHSLTNNFEAHAQRAENGVEFWLARDIQHLLGYAKWENFLNVVSRAKTACEVSGHPVQDHFPDVRKMVDLGAGSQRDIDDKPLISQFVIPDPTFNSPEFEGIGMDGLPCSCRHSKCGGFSIFEVTALTSSDN